MEHILKALNDALESKEFQIKYLNEEIAKLREERDDLKAENEKQAKEVCENIFGNCWKVVFVK